jgi:hypothetical protein
VTPVLGTPSSGTYIWRKPRAHGSSRRQVHSIYGPG